MKGVGSWQNVLYVNKWNNKSKIFYVNEFRSWKNFIMQFYLWTYKNNVENNVMLWNLNKRTILDIRKSLGINPLRPAVLKNFNLSAWAPEWKFANNWYVICHARYNIITSVSSPFNQWLSSKLFFLTTVQPVDRYYVIYPYRR